MEHSLQNKTWEGDIPVLKVDEAVKGSWAENRYSPPSTFF
jgi:hypothetical protein